MVESKKFSYISLAIWAFLTVASVHVLSSPTLAVEHLSLTCPKSYEQLVGGGWTIPTRNVFELRMWLQQQVDAHEASQGKVAEPAKTPQPTEGTSRLEPDVEFEAAKVRQDHHDEEGIIGGSTVREEEDATRVHLYISQNANQFFPDPMPIHQMRERTAADNYRYVMFSFIGSQAFAEDVALERSPGRMQLEIPHVMGSIPAIVPINGSYSRMSGEAKDAAGKNPVEGYMLQALHSSQTLRESWRDKGFLFVLAAHYKIAVGDNRVEGKIDFVEDFYRQVTRGTIDESKADLLLHEKDAADILAEDGHNVVALPRSTVDHERSPDTQVTNPDTGKERTIEIKTHDDAQDGKVDSKTILNRVWSSLKHEGQAPHILIDVRNTEVDVMEAQRAAFRIAGKLKTPKYARYRDRIQSLRIIGLQEGARFDMNFEFSKLED